MFLLLSEPPSEPVNLKVASFNTKAVRVTWEPPKNDGGTPVKQYIIEMRAVDDGDDEFQEVGKVKGGNLSYEAIGLTEGKTYIFRVRALNAAGVSEIAAELDRPVTAKLPYGRPISQGGHCIMVFC